MDGNTKVDRPSLISRINACVNQMPHENQTGQNLLRQIENNTAKTLNIGKTDYVEHHCECWATYTNMSMWFDQLRDFLLEHEFAEKCTTNSLEIKFKSGQTDRIVNVDETGLILDNTKSAKGG